MTAVEPGPGSGSAIPPEADINALCKQKEKLSVRALASIGAALIKHKQYNRALEILQGAIDDVHMARKVPQGCLGDIHLNLGIAYCALDEQQDAIAAHHSALRLYEQDDDQDGVLFAAVNCASSLLVERRYDAVADLLKPLLQSWESGSRDLPDDQTELPLCYALAAQASFKLNDVKLARDLMQSGLTLCEADAEPTKAYGYYTSMVQNMGAFLNALGDFEGALSYHERVYNMHKVHLDMESAGNSAENLASALVTNATLMLKQNCHARLIQMHLDRISDAIPWLQQALFVWQQCNVLDRVAGGFEALGTAYFHQKQFQQALAHYQAAVQIAETHELEGIPLDRLQYRLEQTWNALATSQHMLSEHGSSAASVQQDQDSHAPDILQIEPSTAQATSDQDHPAPAQLMKPATPARPRQLAKPKTPISARLMRSQLLRQRSNTAARSQACCVM
eukprot:TRINITY_DN12039_c0_g1_i10.p3 TRINITY_DN12039_c0_g1~~TRINITY_DN12039_c0_g1_i10.p3  ORF type:complete len:451 (+),score=76.63 TRINITY_DN12039_c0_g1_i10:57-1409(+)